MITSVLMLSPEPPYPMHGGGPYRIASLVHYFSRFASVDLILISESGQPANVPRGLVRSQKIIPLTAHSKSTAARYWRNSRRAVRGVPPLIDRLSGQGPAIASAIGQTRYDLGIIEHFWCAPYIREMRDACETTLLDLHNVESVLHERCAANSSGLIAAGHKRFAAVSRSLEAELLPRFSSVLATSRDDAEAAGVIAPLAHIVVYPNALPWIEAPERKEEPAADPLVVFSGNFEYHPNIDAVRFLVSGIWPRLKERHPELRLRLVGRGDRFIRHLLPANSDIEITGEVPDALAEIRKATIVVAPLRIGSGTRIKILEAWAAARAVVATPLAAEGLTAENGGNIALEASACSFADMVDRLLSDRVERERLALAGRRMYERNYTWNAAWQSLERNLQPACSVQLNRYTG